MSTTSVSFSGDYHILLRLKGSELAIEKFHHIMKICDSDWPYISKVTIRVCRKCGGAVWHSPRIAPEDIKSAARQVGDMRVKIKHFAAVTACRGKNLSFDNTNDYSILSQEQAREIYRANGIKNFKESLVRRVLPGNVIQLPPVTTDPTTERLIAEVMAPPVVGFSVRQDGSTGGIYPNTDSWEDDTSAYGYMVQ